MSTNPGRSGTEIKTVIESGDDTPLVPVREKPRENGAMLANTHKGNGTLSNTILVTTSENDRSPTIHGKGSTELSDEVKEIPHLTVKGVKSRST